MNNDNRIGGFMSEDRKPWIAVRLLLHVDDRSGLFVLSRSFNIEMV